jgi:CBS-domain-containing membrane protein
MREVTVSWGSALKVAWSIGWRLVVYLIPAYALGFAAMLAAMMAGDSLQAPMIWGVLAFYVLQALWLVAIALAFVFAVKHVIGKSYSASAMPRVPESFRIALVSDD